MILIFDCEASGLDVYKDRVWCVVAKDFETGEVYEFPPDKLGEVEKLFCSAEKLVAHNGLAYDSQILKNNGIVDIPFDKLVDTLVLSRLYYPDREGSHSVENWGRILGHPKVEHSEWDKYSEEMLYRCKEDVAIQTDIYRSLLKERGDWSWGLSEKIEHRVQQILFEQEERGWRFNKQKAKGLCDWLSNEMSSIEKEIIHKLPMYYSKGNVIDKPFKKDGSLTERSKKWLAL